MRNMSRGVEGRAQLQGKHCKLKQLFNVEMNKKHPPLRFEPSEQIKSSQGKHFLQFLSCLKKRLSDIPNHKLSH